MPQVDRLLVVDPICSRRAPTIRAWLQVAEKVLPKHFKEVEVWSMECDLDQPWVKWRKFPKITRFWPIQCAAFRFMAWRAYKRLPKPQLQNTLVQATGEHLPRTDIRYIQFWNITYAEIAKVKPVELRAPFKERVFRNWAIQGERKCLEPGATGEWWCVSRGIATPIAAPPGSIFRYLPNSYDPERFNPAFRAASRSDSRKHYQFGEEDIVFVFAGFGHFVRKGLLQAVKVVNRLRQQGNPATLLVLGGTEGTVADFRRLMDLQGESAEAIRFAGHVSPPEWHLSAGDALLFPSHFEAFSLVEIEAAALGLRLYLTAHPGSEMILREGENGRLLPWNVDGMVATLSEDIASGVIRETHCEMGEALSPDPYAALLSSLYSDAILKKLRA
ncbi:MAG: glycosyltransferase family 4 protein [Verrucomicrobiota bacterium]